MIHIRNTDSLDTAELSIYNEQSEVQLYRINEPEPGIFIAESPKVIERALNAGYEPISLLIENSQIKGEAAELLAKFDSFPEEVPVFSADDNLLTSITGFHLTRGVLCAMKRKPLPSVSDICANAKRIAVLENVTNPTNVGAIVRSAAALSIDAVLFSHGCTDPLYRRAIRVSMGNIFQISWTFLPKNSGTDLLKDMGFSTVAMALRDDSRSIDDPEISSSDKIAIYLGAEGDGLLAETIDSCDFCVKIPMSHDVDSLNVAAASAVAFYAISH
ncbi:TrmH family RNA methyltransferase [Butyrivibrio sp. WCE2006]|uniref:TrmH family RNA methyltransferase n=1 Tax=Butyrivibrio sp. WCE2006 TaxID=1410611 RepID=UPI0005D25A37|nr:RNA methyltransferase [Butyrivibrio sp. WCE2006]